MLRKLVLHILLLPASLIYGGLVSVRNLLYDAGILKSSRFSVPVISIGNLTIGGAGKSPHIEWLTTMLKDYINVAILSRGYKRQTKGFRLVQTSDTASDCGDEPLQFKRKFADDVVVAVSESRAYGIPMVIRHYSDTQVILLDDAFQHREVHPDLNILLTDYRHLYTDDFILPAGRLREWPSASHRADIIVVSKCPDNLSVEIKENVLKKLNPREHQKVFFSYYQYDYPYSLFNSGYRISLDTELDVILLSSIANTEYLLEYLERQVGSIHQIEFTDHHQYSKSDMEFISKVWQNRDTVRKIILTTEKDATRLEPFRDLLQEWRIAVFVLPVRVAFHFNEEQKLSDLVKQFLLEFRS